MDTLFLEKIKNSTPIYQQIDEFEDADDEMREIAEYIKKTTQHNEYVEPKRVKYLYTSKPKKDGSRYGLFDLVKRNGMEKMIDDKYDFILTVFYDVWKDLTPEQRIISLDKALCAIDMGTMETPKIGKQGPDSKEYTANMRYYGADKVMGISETIDLACQRILDERKDALKEKRQSKKGKKQSEMA